MYLGIMKILREKIFGAIKRANKAKKKDWEINRGQKVTGQPLADHVSKRVSRAGNLVETTGAYNVNLIDPDTGKQLSELYSPELRSRLIKEGKAPLHERINARAFYKGRDNKVPAKIHTGEDMLYFDTLISHKEVPNIADRAGRKNQNMIEFVRNTNRQKDEVNASIKKHKDKAKDKAKELRETNKLKVAARDAKRQIKKNPGKSAAIGATVAATGAGLGYAAYKHHKNKKKDGDSKKK